MREYLSTVTSKNVTSGNSDKVMDVLSRYVAAIDDVNADDVKLSLSIMEAVINIGGLSAKNSSQSTRIQKVLYDLVYRTTSSQQAISLPINCSLLKYRCTDSAYQVIPPYRKRSIVWPIRT